MKRFWQIWALAAAIALSLGASAARAEPQNVATSIVLSGASTTAVYAQGVGEAQLLLVADSANDQLRTVEVRTGEEITAAVLDLPAGCSPQDLLASGTTLYVACMGTDMIEVVDLSLFELPNPSLSPAPSGAIAVGDGPSRLLIAGNGADDYLIIQNVTEKSASVISLSSMNAPIAINADDSTETGSAPVNVRLCGADADPAMRATPVGLGVGFERIYIGCDDGVVSWFDPFNNTDFSLSAETPPLGVGALAAAFGRSGEHGLFLQASDGALYVVDLSEAELGGNAFAQVLYNDGASDFYSVPGPGSPRGLLTFFDAETSSRWLALLGNAQVDLFDVGDLGDVAYMAPMSRDPDLQLTSDLSMLGTNVVRPAYGAGNLFVPTGGAEVNVILAGPPVSFTAPLDPQMVSSQMNPGMGYCAAPAGVATLPISLTWKATGEDVAAGGCTVTLDKSTDSAAPLGCTIDNMDSRLGSSSLALSDISDLAGLTEEVNVNLEVVDDAGNPGLARKTIFVDGGRPSTPAGFTAALVNGKLSLSWDASNDVDEPLGSGVASYAVMVTRTSTPAVIVKEFTTTSIVSTLQGLDPTAPLLKSDEKVSVSVASCDNTGNSSMPTSTVTLDVVLIGAAAQSGETGGCVINPITGGALLPLAMMVALAGLVVLYRRRSARR